MTELMRGAEPFCWQGKQDTAVLLLHGYTGSAGEMRLPGEYLYAQGYTVSAPLLPGHGTCPEDLQNTRAADWYAGALEAYRELQQRYNKVVVVGLSMGGLLALRLAAEQHPAGLVTMSAPMFLYDKRLPWVRLLCHFMPYVQKKPRPYEVDDRYNVAYKGKIPTKPVYSMLQLIRHCKDRCLKHITCPALIMQGGQDFTVKPESGEYIYNNLASSHKRLRCFEQSRHLIIFDKERQAVMQELLDFVAYCAKQAGADWAT